MACITNSSMHAYIILYLSAPTRSACPSLPTNFNDEWHALLIHQCMHISYYTHILINATTLCHFMLLCATLLSLCARLRPFMLLYATLFYFTVFRHIGWNRSIFANCSLHNLYSYALGVGKLKPKTKAIGAYGEIVRTWNCSLFCSISL